MLAANAVADGQVVVFILCKKFIVVIADVVFHYVIGEAPGRWAADCWAGEDVALEMIFCSIYDEEILQVSSVGGWL